MKRRDPSWRIRHAKGHRVERDRSKYRRKVKHRKDARRDAGVSRFRGCKTVQIALS